MSVETKIEIFCNKENFYPDHINKNILVIQLSQVGNYLL